jgi:hypothetical protein
MTNAGRVGAGNGASSGSAAAVEEVKRAAANATIKTATAPATSAIRAGLRSVPRISR